MRTRYLDILAGKATDKTPIWIMRQAGRYLPEYRNIRSKFPNFMDMCRNSEACCEVALQPLERYDLDASIVFSDILTIPDAMGMKLEFLKGVGPVFSNPLQTQKNIDDLDDSDIALDRLSYVMNAVKTTKLAVKNRVPLIGFCGSPWTLAAYMIEGQGSKTFNKARKMLYAESDMMHKLLNKITTLTVKYLLQQINSGADALMIFDTWGGLLSPEKYLEFSLHYMKLIVKRINAVHADVPITVFTKNGGLWLDDIKEIDSQGIGVDWTISLNKVFSNTANVAIQGNIDPALLYSDKISIELAIKKLFNQVDKGRFII